MVRGLSLCIVGLALGLLALPGCGNDDESLPGGVVAQVRGQPISTKALDHAMIGRRAITRSAENAPPFWPHDVAGCMRAIGKRPSTRELSREELRARCEAIRERERDAALRVLIHGRWYALEAKRRGLELPPSRQAIVAAAEHSGVEPADIADISRGQQLLFLLSPPTLTAPPPRPSRAAILRHFRAHRDRYALEAQWFLDAVVVPTRAVARRALSEFRKGRTSAQLMKTLEGRGATRPYDGNFLPADLVGRDGVERAVRDLEQGDVGMVRDPRGWYVFRVGITSPRREATLESAASNVQQDLQTLHTRRTIERYNAGLQSRYRDDTVCADDFDLPECR